MKKTLAIILTIIILIAIIIVFKNINTMNIPLDIKSEFINYLESKIQDDGSFKYITNLDNTKVLDDYSILRHSLSYYALLKGYEKEEKKLIEKRAIIENGINYILGRIVEKDDAQYIISDNMSEVDLGNCSLALIFMCEYQNAFEDYKYQDNITKLANGILSMQRLDGSFNHLCFFDSMLLKQKNVIVYYDGEAVLALCKAYGNIKDEKYLNSAKKAIDYYISSGYEKYADHWQEYGIIEFLKYNNEKKYIDYAITNLNSKREIIKNNKQVYNTDLEVLNAGISLCNIIDLKNENYSFDEAKNIYENEINLIKKEFMSFENNNRVESFFLNRGQKSIRIDDLAHYILATI